MSKTFLFQAIQFCQTVQFSISMQSSSIQPIGRALSGSTIPGQSGPGSSGNEEGPHIPQSSSITGTSPSDCFMSYPGYSLNGGSHPSAEVQSVYSTAPPPSWLGNIFCTESKRMIVNYSGKCIKWKKKYENIFKRKWNSKWDQCSGKSLKLSIKIKIKGNNKIFPWIFSLFQSLLKTLLLVQDFWHLDLWIVVVPM